MRSCSDVHNFLHEEGVPHEIVHLPAPSSTAARAAEALGVPVDEVIKSLVFRLDGEPLIVLIPGDTRVDTLTLADALGGRRAVPARAQDVFELTGYRPGAVPPCALVSALPAVADPDVFGPDVVYCGGGTTTTMLKIRSADLRVLLRARELPVAARA